MTDAQGAVCREREILRTSMQAISGMSPNVSGCNASLERNPFQDFCFNQDNPEEKVSVHVFQRLPVTVLFLPDQLAGAKEMFQMKLAYLLPGKVLPNLPASLHTISAQPDQFYF